MFPDLSLDILNSVAVSMYSLFESRYAVRIIRAEERLRAVSADRVSAELLQVAEGSPLLLVESASRTPMTVNPWNGVADFTRLQNFTITTNWGSSRQSRFCGVRESCLVARTYWFEVGLSVPFGRTTEGVIPWQK
ncbi:UTRA domain-containing protein [Propionivibrio sp.]|uniref:UTRA domain-containing protein n=1 Tax=Propionivibrio sp. TaxID=2212460 RepID=UPI0026003D0F|nr:UTRA domain-containing protein [Propionivibrio sp.]